MYTYVTVRQPVEGTVQNYRFPAESTSITPREGYVIVSCPPEETVWEHPSFLAIGMECSVVEIKEPPPTEEVSVEEYNEALAKAEADEDGD